MIGLLYRLESGPSTNYPCTFFIFHQVSIESRSIGGFQVLKEWAKQSSLSEWLFSVVGVIVTNRPRSRWRLEWDKKKKKTLRSKTQTSSDRPPPSRGGVRKWKKIPKKKSEKKKTNTTAAAAWWARLFVIFLFSCKRDGKDEVQEIEKRPTDLLKANESATGESKTSVGVSLLFLFFFFSLFSFPFSFWVVVLQFSIWI